MKRLLGSRKAPAKASPTQAPSTAAASISPSKGGATRTEKKGESNKEGGKAAAEEETKNRPSPAVQGPTAEAAAKREKIIKNASEQQVIARRDELAKAIQDGDAVKKWEINLEIAKLKVDIAKVDVEDATDNNAKRAALLALQIAVLAQRKAEYDQKVASLEKRIAEAKGELSSFIPLIAQQAAKNFTAATTELDNLRWDEAAEKAKLAQEYPAPSALDLSSLIQIEWPDVSNQVSTLAFSLNRILDDDESHRAVLGPLYKPGFKWPVIVTSESDTKTIDMRLLSRKVYEPNGDALRPAARELSSRLKVGRSTKALVAVPGVGKSSALIDLGREHYVIYIQSSRPTDIPGRGAMSRHSREFDRNFVTMIEELKGQMASDAQTSSMMQNWNVALHRTMVELVARTLQLVRMHRELKLELNPWLFAVHQLAGKQDFVSRMVKVLRNASVSSLEGVLDAAMQELAPLFTEEIRFAVAIDEMDLAAYELRELFMRPKDESDDGSIKPKGILSPLVRAVSNLSPIADWSLVLAGTGTSEESVANLRTDLGKLKVDNVIRDAHTFPLTQASDVLCLLGRLDTSQELRDVLATGLEASPLHQPVRDTLASDDEISPIKIKYLLEDYVFPARFRVLCAVFEYIRKCLGLGNPDKILRRAIRMSVDQHKDGLHNLLLVRLDPRHPNGLHSSDVDAYLSYLLQITVAVQLTDGRTSFLEPPAMPSSITDLTRLGIAAMSETNDSDEPLASDERSIYSAFKVCERFVIEVLIRFFEDPIVRSKAQDGRMRSLLSMLQNVLSSFGTNTAFKGNVVEKLILERLVVLARDHTKVTTLPFFPSTDDASWEDWEFAPSRVEQCSPDHSTPEFLSSDAASDVVYSPETVCRPDGIVMLRRKGESSSPTQERRAISLGVAVYTQRVPKDKVESQFWSTDLSRAYLNTDHEAYDATLARRQLWVDQKLHETVALRVHVFLPHAKSAVAFASQRYQRETRVSPTGFPRSLRESRRTSSQPPSHQDLVVNMDRSNIQNLLGKRGVDEKIDQLYQLLEFATGVKGGWGE